MSRQRTSDVDEFEVSEEELEGEVGAGSNGEEIDDSALDAENDLSAVELPAPLPRAWYRLTVVSSVPGMSQGNAKKGTGPSPKIDLRCKVEDPGGRFDGRNVFDILSFAEGALPFTKLALQQLGLTPAQMKLPVRQKAELLLHVTAEALVDIQKGNAEYPGDRNRIRQWRALKPESLD